MVDLRARAHADVDALTAEFIRLVDRAWEQLAEAEAALIRDYLTLSARERARREAEIERLASHVAETVTAAAREQIRQALTGAYQLGIQRTAAAVGRDDILNVADSDLLRATRRETYGDILTATKYVKQTTKELVRKLARQASTQRVRGGITAEDAGAALAKQLEGEGIAAIVYRNGSRHGLDDYAEMLMRTKTAEIYQVGGFEQARAFDVGFMELLDNPSCGLDGHNDPTKANGLILPIDQAEQYPISHPRCVRVTVARPDILTPADAKAAKPSTTAAQNTDQRTVEQARAARRPFESRATRKNAGLLNPSTDTAASPAARRAAARVQRRAAASAPQTSSTAAAKDLLASATAAEPHLTHLVTNLAAEHGGVPTGLDFRLKGIDSLTRKIEADVAETGRSAQEVASGLFDVNRYTTVFSESRYARSAQDTLDSLREQGYTTRVKNYWNVEGNPYQGINVQVTGSAGERFELQFHTPTSLEIKEGEMHAIYELQRVETDAAKIADYTQQSFAAAAKIPVPMGVAEVS